MSIARVARTEKRQRGQFLTPMPLAANLIADSKLERHHRVLEPSFGTGSFLLPLIEKFMAFYEGDTQHRLTQVLQKNVYGVELDTTLYGACLDRLEKKYGSLPPDHSLLNRDFFVWHPHQSGLPEFGGFDFVLGNPPFGGTIDPSLQDQLDRRYGFRCGEKIKKETYSFFLVKSLDLLREGGSLQFICSDTFLTIKTMHGLRRLLMSLGRSEIETLTYFSEETKHPMVLLTFTKSLEEKETVHINGQELLSAEIAKTPNLSWGTNAELGVYFEGKRLGDYLIATSGMTVGNNALFLRAIHHVEQTEQIVEPYCFEFYDETVTVEKELQKARLGQLSLAQRAKIASLQEAGVTNRNVRAIPRAEPITISLPHPDYRPYNKASGRILSAPPTHVIYWKDEGDAVYTYRKNANWYLHGVGGKKFFLQGGLTWQLIAPRLHTRLLPQGFILDSGAPCAFLRPGIPEDELYFVLGWTLTEKCNLILKTVINHTRNIQSKDFERLPYPFWIGDDRKGEVIQIVKHLVKQSQEGETFNFRSPEICSLNDLYAYPEKPAPNSTQKRVSLTPQLTLFEAAALVPCR